MTLYGRLRHPRYDATPLKFACQPKAEQADRLALHEKRGALLA